MFKMFMFIIAGFFTGAAWAFWQAENPLNPSFIGAGVGLFIYIVLRTITVFFSSGKKLDLD